jgi:hypothetical protein
LLAIATASFGSCRASDEGKNDENDENDENDKNDKNDTRFSTCPAKPSKAQQIDRKTACGMLLGVSVSPCEAISGQFFPFPGLQSPDLQFYVS